MANFSEQSLDTPNIRESEAGLCLHSTTRIGAPASLVFRTLRNTDTWKDWNKFVPRVTITYQTPEEDLATAAEIEELVRNTSIAGSFDSDLTDGMADPDDFKKRLSQIERPETPPLRLRMNSQASRGSNHSGNELSPTAPAPAYSPPTNGGGGVQFSTPSFAAKEEPKLSSAQKYQQAQAERKASIAAGGPPPVAHNLIKEAATEPYLAAASSPSGSRRGSTASPRNSLQAPEIDPTGRRKSKTPSLQKAMKQRQNSLNLLYGEPSVRLQLHTRMTFHIRMNPHDPHEFRQTHFAVTEVSRPDDPITDGSNLTQLTRSKTHTLNRTMNYRIVWAMDNTMSSMLNMKNGSAFPKSLLVTERVHEIRPITLGDGSEECELRTWELQKGPLSKVTRKKFGGYLQTQFEIWGQKLGEFCEVLTGQVDRRDFISLVDSNEKATGVITF